MTSPDVGSVCALIHYSSRDKHILVPGTGRGPRRAPGRTGPLDRPVVMTRTSVSGGCSGELVLIYLDKQELLAIKALRSSACFTFLFGTRLLWLNYEIACSLCQNILRNINFEMWNIKYNVILHNVLIWINPYPLGCVQNRIQIGGFGTVMKNWPVSKLLPSCWSEQPQFAQQILWYAIMNNSSQCCC